MSLNALQIAAINHLVAKDFGAALSDIEFCERMGFTDRTLRRWQAEDDEFIRTLDASRKEARETTDMYALRTRQWALEELETLYKKAKTAAEKRAVLKDILAQTKDVVNKNPSIDYEHLPDEELVNIFRGRNLSTEGVTEERLVALAMNAKED